jgi:hypothetical protein
MKMPISEIIDRYTITLLKTARAPEDVSEEMGAYKKEIDRYPHAKIYIDRLLEANSKIWDLETEGGREDTSDPSAETLIKMGKIAISVRHWNRIRNGVKADIVEKYSEGFKEIKTNYTKTDYGWDSHEE